MSASWPSISTTASRAGTRRWRPCTRSAAARPSGKTLRDVFPVRVLRCPGQVPQRIRRTQSLQVPSHDARRRAAYRQRRDRSPSVARFRLRGPHHPGGRHHRARHPGSATCANRQAQFHRPARGRRGARDQHARWPSSPATRRCSPSSCAATPASGPCWRRSPSRASAPPRSPTAC